MIHRCVSGFGWDVPRVLRHTLAELNALARQTTIQARLAKGEPPDGAVCSAVEIKRYLKEFHQRHG